MYKKTIAKEALNHTITSVGIAIYLPKTPDVLINKVASNNPERFFIWLFSIKFYEVFLMLCLLNQHLIISVQTQCVARINQIN